MDYDFCTHENKTKWRVAPKRQTGAAAKHLLKQTADFTVLQSQIEPLLNQKSQIVQEYGLLLADAQKQMSRKFFLLLYFIKIYQL